MSSLVALADGVLHRATDEVAVQPRVAVHVEAEEVERDVINGDRVLALAEYPNVFVKFSVLGLQRISNTSYPHKDAQLFFEKVYQLFGSKRIMGGSNYPPVLSEEGYAKTLRFLHKEIPYLSAEDKEWLMGKTALEMWRFH